MSEDLCERIGAIYEAYYDDIYYFLLYFTGSQDDAEDMVHEVFSRLLRVLPQYDGRVTMKTWLFSIAKYIAIDHYRKQKWQRLFSDSWLSLMKSKEGLPESEFETKEERQRIKTALQKLKPHLRIIVILRYIKEYSVKETAEVLAISETKVRVDCHRGLKALQKILGESEEGGIANGLAR
ncbi:DNA-directed RNA polymerase sigma-70 factor [Brevibacillus reuszeri]|uniref:RNA polymerase sigma-70 factor n=1 Tax=Brevibacillus reuszeri TaxID=54915 RepID=A0A0K9Z0W1_9BACL|nr:RNA polymerase sigma factor [Brevibacillus reuszeri]KNB74604.1 RNA polymerase sigma-70 factor [Brevibacillus reuszeri]MED1856542.1 RNA polymerase sigma factor [Brevibacillus reuszeri]GED67759.1 DNA-directed RNA polymerase sigma-70 factor [Brevibacillus reuszeri]